MAPKHEESQRLALLTPSVDDWIDERKKLEGAEGLWRIHNKLYDFTVWSRTHPGGKFWINITRGTDITEVFESHHLTNKTESILHKYYRREAVTPRNFSTTFNENGFYKIFKRKVAQKEFATSTEHSSAVPLISDCLAAAVFLSGLLGIKNGIFWTITSGILLSLLSVSSHSFFHTKENWRIYYFDLSLMSSRDWKIRHVLSHHPFRNTVSDLEIPIWKSFAENQGTITKYMQLLPNLLMFFVAAHIQFLQRCADVFLSKKLRFNSEELVAFSFPLFLFFFSGVNLWEAFVVWNVIIMIGSFCFCLFSSSFYMDFTQTNLSEKYQREKHDFGIYHLSIIGNHSMENNFVLSFLNSFRGNVIHYLCPTISCGSLREFISELKDASHEVGISHVEKSTGFFDEFESKMPQGHTFFS